MNSLKILSFFLLLLCPLCAADQAAEAGAQKLPELLDARDKLLADYSRATRELDKLDRKYKATLDQEAFIKSQTETLNKLERDAPTYETEKQRLGEDIANRIKTIGERTSEVLAGEKEKIRKTIQEMGNQLKTGASSILGERDEQNFRKSVSYVFACLIFAVILGFFTIAFKDPKVRLQVFTGDNGIQFVTLFSLVIAIILFGIMKVLEGKELSALLGGLSGYILGRSRTNPSQPAPQPDPPASG